MALLTNSPTAIRNVVQQAIGDGIAAHATYPPTAARLTELRVLEHDLEQQRRRIVEGLSGNAPGDAALIARADALLRDDAIPRGRDTEAARLRDDLGAVVEQLAVVRQAIRLQEAIVAREWEQVSKEICEKLRPLHRQINATTAAGIAQTSAGLTDERELRETLIEGGVHFAGHLRPMPFVAATLADENSHASVWMRDARESGLID